MLTLQTAVTLSLLPGRSRLDAAARIREQWPDLFTLPSACGPSLDALAGQAAPQLAAEPALLRRLQAAAAAALARADSAGIVPVPVTGAAYPARLRAIADAPLVLWTLGETDALRAPAVAIVGARAATPAGREMAHWLARELAAEGLVVVSGLARGIDAAAHEGALVSGRTVAVLGSGSTSSTRRGTAGWQRASRRAERW